MNDMSNTAQTVVLSVAFILRLCFIIVTAAGAGCLWPRVSLLRSRNASTVIFSILNGLGILGTLTALAAFFSVLKLPVVLPVVCASFATGCVFLWHVWRGRSVIRVVAHRSSATVRGSGSVKHKLRLLTRSTDRLGAGHIFLCVLVVAFLLFFLSGALAPDSQQDSQWYHLSVARAWIFHNSLAAWPEVYPSNYSLLCSALYALALLIGNDSVDCSLIQWVFGALTVGASALFALEWYGRRAAMYCAFFVVTAMAGTVWFVPMHVSSDLAVSAFMAAGLLLLVDELFGAPLTTGCRAQPVPLHIKQPSVAAEVPLDPFGINRLAAAGLFLGFGLACKLTALGWAMPGVLLLLAFALVRRNKLHRLPVRRAVWVLGWVGVPCILWVLRNTFIGCGNPIYPLARAVVPLREGWELLGLRYANVNNVYPFSLHGFMQMVSESSVRFDCFFSNASSPVIVHGLAVVTLLAMLVLRPKVRSSLPQTAIALGYIGVLQWGVLLCLQGRVELVRMFGQCLAPVMVVAGWMVVQFEESGAVSVRLRRVAIGLLVVAVCVPVILRQWQWSTAAANYWDFRPKLTATDRMDYLRKCPYTARRIDLFMRLNKVLPADAVVMVATGNFPFYLERKYFWCDDDITIPGEYAKRGIDTAPLVRNKLRELGVTHVVADEPELPPYWLELLSPLDEETSGAWTL